MLRYRPFHAGAGLLAAAAPHGHTAVTSIIRRANSACEVPAPSVPALGRDPAPLRLPLTETAADRRVGEHRVSARLVGLDLGDGISTLT